VNELELAQGKEKSTIIKAVEALKLSVTAPQVAASTGMPLARTVQLLNQVAAETDGNLIVSERGEIQYKFASNFKDKYFTDTVKKVALKTGLIVFEAGFYFLRISFGILLTLSLLVIVLLFIALIMAACNDSGGGGDFSVPDVGGFDVGSIGDGFAWHYTPGHQEKLYEREYADEKKADFFLEVFSFLFGDGDPNSHLDKIRWQYIAKLIVDKGGVVTEEELKPYLEGEKSSVLPVLVRFNGRPEVTDNGGIVYVFEELARQSSNILDTLALPSEMKSVEQSVRSKAEARYYDLVIRPQEAAIKNLPSEPEKVTLQTVKRPPFLEEKLWTFSQFPLSSNLWVTTLAAINLCGSWWLYKHIATSNLLHHYAYLIDCLLAYAIIFVALPFCRIIFNWGANVLIEERNRERQKAFAVIERPHAELRKTMEEGAKLRQELALTMNDGPGKVVYTTERENLEQEFEQKIDQHFDQSFEQHFDK
jgi:hypothetical protein